MCVCSVCYAVLVFPVQDNVLGAVAVAVPRGWGFNYTQYNLTVQSANWINGTVAYAYFKLTVNITETRVLQPVADQLCYLGDSCPVVVSPSMSNLATQFFLQLLTPNQTAIVASIGIVNRNDTGVLTSAWPWSLCPF